MRVVVKEIKTGKIIKALIVSSERKAEKVLAGLEINLNHDKYYATIIYDEKEAL